MFKEFNKTTYAYLALIVALTIPLCINFFGSRLINGHDAMAGLMRALSMAKYMGHGQVLVRWSPEINMGYGYPMFNFYPPFFSFISVLIFQLTQNMVLAINWACILFWFLSGIGMFLLAREYWGDEGGMLSALLYVYAPYHIIDLYIRGAFAEFSSFAFFPFLLYFILKLSQRVRPGVFLGGVVSVFGLSLAHNIMSMLFFPVAVAFMLYLYFFENKSAWVLTAVCMFVTGLMMSSFFWVPALVEKQYLNLNFLIGKHYDFHQNFVSMSKLFWPFNHWGMDHISFEVGVFHSLLCLGTLVCISKIFQINKQSARGYIFILIVGLMAVFFTLPCSSLWWEHIHLLDYVQFPWRFLTIIVFSMSFLAGSVLLLIKNFRIRVIALCVAGLLSVLFYFETAPKADFFSSVQNIEDFIALGDGEYTPRWVKVPPGQRPERKFEIVRGGGLLGNERMINPVNYETKLQSMEPNLVCFHTFYFPGWKVYLDGQGIEPYLDNPFGLILFNVPAGDHDIQVLFGATPIRVTASIISWAGVFLLLVFLGWIKFLK